MKQCLVCSAKSMTNLRECQNCGSVPQVVDGFDAYAPKLAHEGGGFKANYFENLAGLEEENFWFRARNEIIIWALKEYASNFSSLHEIGCGTGFVLSRIANVFPGALLSGSEIFTNGLQFAAQRLPSVNLVQLDARSIPFVEEFDVIGAFDVLEHIKEDGLVLEQIYKALKSDGVFLLTVPQHQWLWSAVDDYACHERRYSHQEIIQKLNSAGFEIVRSTSFVTALLPAMMASRSFSKGGNTEFNPMAECKIHPAINSLLERVLQVEFLGIKAGISYPVGGSRLVVSKKG